MCFGTVLDHLNAILVHFEQNLKIGFFNFLTILGYLGPFWALLALFGPFLGPFWTSKWPQEHKKTGAYQNWAKGGQKAIKMCFGTVLDHLDAILVHFEQNLKIEFFDFLTILGPFWAQSRCNGVP